MTKGELLLEIKHHPERHRHSFDELMACSSVNGAVDAEILAAHETNASVGQNGGRSCDVTSGPCSCGAWH